MKERRNTSFQESLSKLVDNKFDNDSLNQEERYLATQAPNIVEWVTGIEYWNVPSTYRYSRQYQIMRDLFNLRCVNCNSQNLEDIDCWNKGREYLESECLLRWEDEYGDFICPKCRNTRSDFLDDGLIKDYNELICIAGMRSGKSYLGAHIGGYIEHVLRTYSMQGKGAIQRLLKQEKSEWFEATFAASTATQARDTIYAKYREMRNNSPWINRHVTWILEKENQQLSTAKDKWKYKALDDSIIDGFMQVRFNRVSSNSAGIAGKTRVFCAIDELSRLSVSDSKMSAQELYRVLNQSNKTVRGAVRKYRLFPFFGLMLNVTSPIAYNDYAMQIYAQAEEGERSRTSYWHYPTWEFNPELTFEDFKDEFEKDPIAAQRDFGADPPAAETPLVNDVLRFWKSVDHERKPIATFKTTYLIDKTGKQYVGSKIDELKYNFIDQHYIFCDAAETFDSFAMVCAHPVIIPAGAYREDVVNDENYSNVPKGMKHISELQAHPDSPISMGLGKVPTSSLLRNPANLGRMVTVVDFCMRIVPTRERDIWFQSIIEIIKEIRKKIKIAAVCFDSWQSSSSMQAIRDMGVQSYKVRLKSENFLEFIAQVYNDQVSLLPPHADDHFSISETGGLLLGRKDEEMSGDGVGLLELLKLERSPDLKRVLAPAKGSVRGRDSDDVARCIVGVNTIIKDSVVLQSASGRKRDLLKRQTAVGLDSIGRLYTSAKKW